MAAARVAEAAHQAEPHEASPLAGAVYEGELGLLRFSEAPADQVIDEFADRFAASGSAGRERLREALTMDDLYTLLRYARRAALRTIRDRDGTAASRGLAALAAVDCRRVDGRDLVWQAAVLSYAIGRISGDVSAAFEAAASLAEGETTALLSDRARKPVASLREWRLREVSTAAGIGLVTDHGGPYRPGSDLLAIADRVAADMEGGDWQLGEPAVGGQVQAVWLRAGQAAEVEEAIGLVSGCVSIQGTLASQVSLGFLAPHMLVYIAETQSPQAADTIARAAGPGPGGSFAAIGTAADTLCAVIMARSVVQGTPNVETQASLERFRPVLADALAH
jgi:hypothetical protein